MPRYDFECFLCLNLQEAWRSIERRHEAPACDECGGPTLLQISTPAGIVDSLPYHYDEGLGQTIESRTQRRNAMRAAGVEEAGTTYRDKRGVIYSLPKKGA